MFRWLEENRAAFQQLREYQKLWDTAMTHSGQPIPCPDCHLAGKISRLSPLATEKGVGRVVCNVCHAQFQFPDEA